ncbi:translocator protein homolog [Rutidosis leptorrhynchoides]|uniref:translocator protein homolog n=1 Tax=Rutidosis leptorrhynchoides TaxID=125765 RepID=UPI003A9A4B7B
MSYIARARSQKRPSTASGGVRSLAFAVVVPVSLTLTSICYFGESDIYNNLDRPFWIPPLWALHLTCLSSAFVMGLSAWLVWAESGFHRKPMAMVMYLAHLGFSLAWETNFFKMGPTQMGLAMSLGQMVTILSCSCMFSRINPIAGDLVKLCLVWTGFLMSVNLYYVI